MNKALWISVAAIVGVVGIFLAGYQYGNRRTTDRYETQIAKDKAAQAEAAQALEAKYREKENESAKKVADALAARDKAVSNAAALRADAQRLRVNSENLSKRLSTAAGQHVSSGDSSEVKLGRCESLLAESSDLLGESVELAGEGASLSVRIAADKETMRATCVAGDMANFVGGSEIIGN